MKILKKKKQRGYNIAIFLFCTFYMLMPVTAQNIKVDTLTSSDLYKKQAKPQKEVLLKKQNNETSIQSVSTVSGERMLHRPAFQMENALDGILPGLTTSIANGYPTSQSSLSLRGRSLLIVVDGIPRSDANIPASQIESISVIKDGLGLTGMGMASGNGVLYIKTKRGKERSLKIELTAQLAFQQQTNRPKFLNSYQYSQLLNEALVNDGFSPMYSDRDIELFKSGASPFTHPDVNWYDELTRKTTPIQQYNLNIYGGGQVARYYVDLNVYDEDGFLKQDKSVNSYNTRESFKKYSLRANTDINITSSTLLSVNLFGQMFRETTPGNGVMGSIYPAMHYTPNNAYPVLNPDGTFGGSPIYSNNLHAQSIYSGYYLYPKTDFNIDVTLEHKFKDALEGLYVSGTYSYNSSYREQLNRSKGYGVHYYWKDPDDTSPDSPSNYTRLTDGSAQKNESTYSRQNRMQYLQLSAGYDFSINENNIRTKASYLYNDYNIQGTNLPMIKNGVNFSAEYDFAKKYMAEVMVTGMSLNQLDPDSRWGWFPSVGLGWNISNEDWFKESFSNIDLLKLRATYGEGGSDGSGSYYRSGTGILSNYYYTYMKYYEKKDGAVITGSSPAGNNIYLESGLPYLTKWEKIQRLNIGVDVEAFNKTLSGTVEFFSNTYSDILQQGVAGYNGLLGVAAPNENIGKYRQNGLELDVNYNNKIGKVEIFANVNATMYWTKKLADAGLYYPETYMERIGRPNNMTFGYVADGLFQSQSEIDDYLKTTKIPDYTPQPGDIKYVDINNDGVIDGKDVKGIGTSAPRIDYGIYLGVKWNGLSLSAQWSGVANRSITVQDLPFVINEKGGYGQALEEHLDRWTPTNPNASYPRLSSTGNSYNKRTSTFWLKSGAFLKLKNLELAYTLPKKWTSSINLSNVKVFTNAYNLLTLTGLENRDPELYNLMDGTVPNVKAFNFGLNIQF